MGAKLTWTLHALFAGTVFTTRCPRAPPADPCMNDFARANDNVTHSFNFAYDGDSCSVEVDAQRSPSHIHGKENGQGNSARSTEVRDAPFALTHPPLNLGAIFFVPLSR